jgi:hypothetical protein
MASVVRASYFINPRWTLICVSHIIVSYLTFLHIPECKNFSKDDDQDHTQHKFWLLSIRPDNKGDNIRTNIEKSSKHITLRVSLYHLTSLLFSSVIVDTSDCTSKTSHCASAVKSIPY